MAFLVFRFLSGLEHSSSLSRLENRTAPHVIEFRGHEVRQDSLRPRSAVRGTTDVQEPDPLTAANRPLFEQVGVRTVLYV